MDLESKDGMDNLQLQEAVVLTGTGSSNRFKAKRAGEFTPFRCKFYESTSGTIRCTSVNFCEFAHHGEDDLHFFDLLVPHIPFPCG